MPLDERQARHARLLAGIHEYDVHWWHRHFIDELTASSA
jgi:trehalose 6-phosphate synthase